jgi:hypothetical protein
VADESRGPGDGLFYALLGGLCVVVVGGGLYVYENSTNLLDTASPPPIAATPTTPGEAHEGGRLTTLVADARAAIARRDYAAAGRALDEAEHIDSHAPAVVRARNELAEAARRPVHHN